MKYLSAVLLMFLVPMPALAQKGAKPTSVYTSLDAKACRTTSITEVTGASSQVCEGVGGYKLLVHDDDARMSITVVDPQGKEHPLEYWHVVTSSFSSLGPKAEWRVVKRNGKTVPVALIVRVNAQEDTENPNKTTSYLAVARITASGACVVAKIGPSKNMNAEARIAADAAAHKPCLTEP